MAAVPLSVQEEERRKVDEERRKVDDERRKEDDERRKLLVSRFDAFFNASGRKVTAEELQSDSLRWERLDRLIGFDPAPKVIDKEKVNELKNSVEEQVKLYKQSAATSRELDDIAERIALRKLERLSEEDIQFKTKLEDDRDKLAVLISRGLDEIPDQSFVRKVASETGIIPGLSRVMQALKTNGAYSYDHISALLWQSRMYGLAIENEISKGLLESKLQKIDAHIFLNENKTLNKELIDAKRLLVAGLLMHEASRALRSGKAETLTIEQKNSLRATLNSHLRVLEEAAAEESEASTSKSQRAIRTRDALAFSWNFCQHLIGQD